MKEKLKELWQYVLELIAYVVNAVKGYEEMKTEELVNDIEELVNDIKETAKASKETAQASKETAQAISTGVTTTVETVCDYKTTKREAAKEAEEAAKMFWVEHEDTARLLKSFDDAKREDMIKLIVCLGGGVAVGAAVGGIIYLVIR